MEYNAADRRDIRKAEKEAKLRELQRREIVTGIMSVSPGRDWMLDVLEFCHIFATSFSSESLNMAFAEGQRSVGLRLLGDIMSACPDSYVQMMRERNERDAARSNSRSSRDHSNGSGGDSAADQGDDGIEDRDESRAES